MPFHTQPSAPRGFTLIELLVVVAILALLMAILLPSLAGARSRARAVKCLANLRAMQLASALYTESNDTRLFQAGLSHGGGDTTEAVAWITTLQPYYSSKLMARCPADTSPHWPPGTGDGIPVSNVSPPEFRRTTYGINNYLDTDLCPAPLGSYPKLGRIPRPFATIQFIEMATEGPFAGADHPHVENWPANPPFLAASQLETAMHGGKPKTWKAKANYGFLDGHAESLTFDAVYESIRKNDFDPAVAR